MCFKCWRVFEIRALLLLLLLLFFCRFCHFLYEKRKMRDLRQQRVEQMIKSAEGGAGLLLKITKPTAWRRGTQILKKEEDDARLLDRCEANRKEWAKHWQCDESVQNFWRSWTREELKKLEEALQR